MQNAKRGTNEPGSARPGTGSCRLRAFPVLLCLLLAALSPRSAASPPASVLEGGVMVWGSGEPVAGTIVTARGEDLPITRATTSDSSGRFRFPLLPPGRYSVTASAPGYSTVTIVGVVVAAGEERRVRLEVTQTDEEESVTETVNATLQARGIDGGWVVTVMESESLPLLLGTIGEVAALFPVVSGDPATRGEEGSLPLEAVGLASVVTSAAGAEVGRVDENRLVVVPRWGAGQMLSSVRLARGENVTSDGSDGAEAGRSWDDWFRGALTLGGSGADGNLSGFLAIDHDERGRRAASETRTAITATAALANSAERSLFFIAEGSVVDGRVESVLPAELQRTRWSIRASHAWQLSARAANSLDLSVEDHADDIVGEGTESRVPSLRVRERSVRLDERVAWLPGSRLRHELRAGVTAKIGLDDRLTFADSMSGARTFRGDRDESGAWVEDELNLDRLVLRGGLRVDRWDGAGAETTEVAPRVAITWRTTGDDPFVVRGSWGRFHETPEFLDMLVGMDAAWLLPDDIESESLRPMRTDRAVVGASRDLSGLAAWSLDVISSRTVDVPFVRDGTLYLGDIERRDVTLGGRIDLFGKADALLAWTWSDAEGDLPSWELPEHRGSLSLRAGLPWKWAAAAIVRHDSGLPGPAAETDATDSSTTLDLSLSKSFAPGDGVARLAIEAFNVTGDEPPIRSDRPARSLAVHVSYRFGD